MCLQKTRHFYVSLELRYLDESFVSLALIRYMSLYVLINFLRYGQEVIQYKISPLKGRSFGPLFELSIMASLHTRPLLLLTPQLTIGQLLSRGHTSLHYWSKAEEGEGECEVHSSMGDIRNIISVGPQSRNVSYCLIKFFKLTSG